MESIKEEIEKLKKEKRAIILAHYYVPGEVQEIADYIGDSYFLSKKARETEAEMILFAGVSFMGESAKILNPERTVLLPDAQADCPMAHMASREKIREMREKYEDLAVVCYINSTAELKTMSDVCVTSSNAVDIVKKLPNKNIFFIPDGNLGAYVAAQVPEKNIIVNEGYCPVHREIQEEDVKNARKEHPKASVLVHPECVSEVVRTADFVGSTSEIIQYACQSEEKEFLIGTEEGVLWDLEKKCPEKAFYPVKPGQCCLDMKKVTLKKVRDALKEEKYQVSLEPETMEKARRPLDKMLELGK
ncbi:MAG TPA: quinolinate synthase NadA [Candidatus Blautia merdigallinarum]|uniref:Quinolinate synthase n=1 Tax=Candidatus Blautia merdigallinarum TaxID=2838495 RepID=A0A9D2N628_9FIRM|nr:quinolinate synthase NadA [Candidatus Blautia merdigallinarum]